MSCCPRYQVVNGFKFPPEFEDVENSLRYEARPDDLFIVTYPKNGTTWTQHIVSLILNDGRMPDVYETKGIFGVSPFLERGKRLIEEAKRPFAIKTHLPYDLQPKHPSAKYIVVMRNAKDTCVSLYYHETMFPEYGIQDMDFHSFFKFWFDGETEYGDYFDYVLSWWSHRNDANVLILFYEDMKRDIEANVLKIGKFIGKEYEEKLLANEKNILEQVIDKSSFKAIQKPLNTKFLDLIMAEGVRIRDDRRHFARKGIVGDWKNHMTEEESKLVDQKFHEKLDGTGLELVWKDYGIFGP